jgi:hypothetical protein
MKIKEKKNLTLVSALALAFLVAGCGPEAGEATSKPVGTNPLDSIRIMDTKPEGTLAVQDARSRLKPGDEALVFGQIGGVDSPFFEGYAGFVLGDTEIVFCDEMGEDHCPTPWDACCEDPEVLQKSRASVHFVDNQGEIIPAGMKGFGGLVERSEVTVKGTVAQGSTPENLIVEATGIYVRR